MPKESDYDLKLKLEANGYVVVEYGDAFGVRSKSTRSETRLEADNLTDALHEALSLVEPD